MNESAFYVTLVVEDTTFVVEELKLISAVNDMILDKCNIAMKQNAILFEDIAGQINKDPQNIQTVLAGYVNDIRDATEVNARVLQEAEQLDDEQSVNNSGSGNVIFQQALAARSKVREQYNDLLKLCAIVPKLRSNTFVRDVQALLSQPANKISDKSLWKAIDAAMQAKISSLGQDNQQVQRPNQKVEVQPLDINFNDIGTVQKVEQSHISVDDVLTMRELENQLADKDRIINRLEQKLEGMTGEVNYVTDRYRKTVEDLRSAEKKVEQLMGDNVQEMLHKPQSQEFELLSKENAELKEKFALLMQLNKVKKINDLYEKSKQEFNQLTQTGKSSTQDISQVQTSKVPYQYVEKLVKREQLSDDDKKTLKTFEGRLAEAMKNGATEFSNILQKGQHMWQRGSEIIDKIKDEGTVRNVLTNYVTIVEKTLKKGYDSSDLPPKITEALQQLQTELAEQKRKGVLIKDRVVKGFDNLVEVIQKEMSSSVPTGVSKSMLQSVMGGTGKAQGFANFDCSPGKMLSERFKAFSAAISSCLECLVGQGLSKKNTDLTL